MGHVDREVVRQRLERMLRELDRIDCKLPATCDEYASDANEDRRYELEHRMYIALQALLDTAAHVAVSEGVRDLMTNRDAIMAMASLGIADGALVDRLEGAAGLRNALAHEYFDVDNARVYLAMSRSDDLRLLAAAIWEWLETR